MEKLNTFHDHHGTVLRARLTALVAMAAEAVDSPTVAMAAEAMDEATDIMSAIRDLPAGAGSYGEPRRPWLIVVATAAEAMDPPPVAMAAEAVDELFFRQRGTSVPSFLSPHFNRNGMEKQDEKGCASRPPASAHRFVQYLYL
jgi:hypothetical protein